MRWVSVLLHICTISYCYEVEQCTAGIYHNGDGPALYCTDCTHLYALVHTCIHLYTLVYTCVHLYTLVHRLYTLVHTCAQIVHTCTQIVHTYIHLYSDCTHLYTLVHRLYTLETWMHNKREATAMWPDRAVKSPNQCEVCCDVVYTVHTQNIMFCVQHSHWIVLLLKRPKDVCWFNTHLQIFWAEGQFSEEAAMVLVVKGWVYLVEE